MCRLFDVVRLHVGDHPNIAGVLAERVTRQLPPLRSLERSFVWVLLRHPHRVKVEVVALTLREPEDGLVAPAEPLRCMQPMLEVPDDPVSEPQSEPLEDRVQEGVEREYLAPVNMVANLPADASIVSQDADCFPADTFLH